MGCIPLLLDGKDIVILTIVQSFKVTEMHYKYIKNSNQPLVWIISYEWHLPISFQNILYHFLPCLFSHVIILSHGNHGSLLASLLDQKLVRISVPLSNILHDKGHGDIELRCRPSTIHSNWYVEVRNSLIMILHFSRTNYSQYTICIHSLICFVPSNNKIIDALTKRLSRLLTKFSVIILNKL